MNYLRIPGWERNMKNYLLYDIRTICGRECKHFVKNKSSLFMGITQPILWFLLLGFGMNSFIGASAESNALMGTANYITYIMPGIIVMTTMSGGLFGGAGIVNDVSSGYINKMLSSPISRAAIILGKTAFAIVQTFFQIIIVVLVSLCFGVRLPLSINSILALLFALAFCGQMCAIGTMIAVKLKSHQAVYSFLGTLNVPLIFTSSAFFPSETMPIVMKVISYVNPLTYAVNAIRDVMFGTNNNLPFNVGMLILETIILVSLSVIVFKKEYDNK